MQLVRIFFMIEAVTSLAYCDSILDVVADIFNSEDSNIANSGSILDVADDIFHWETEVLPPKGSKLQALTRKKFNKQVAVHYKEGIESYDSLLDAIQSDLDVTSDIDLDTDADFIPAEISATGKRAAKRFQALLSTTSTNCQKLVNELDSKALAKSNVVSKLQAKIRLQRKNLKKAESKKKGAKMALNVARSALKSKKNNVRTHEEAVRRFRLKAERQNCQPFEVFCQLGNLITGKLKSAVRDLRRARQLLAHNRNRVAIAVRRLDAETGRYNQVLKNMENLRQKQSMERISLHIAKKDRDQVGALNAKMKRCLTIIDNIKDGADNLKLQTDLEYYLDIDNVVMPLKEIGQTIAGLTGTATPTVFLPKLTNGQIKEIKDKLHGIKT